MKRKSRARFVAQDGERYAGILAEPAHVCLLAIDLDAKQPASWFCGSRTQWADGVEKAQAFRQAHLTRCIIALAEHYKVDLNSKDAGIGLAMALASRHVPAFKVRHLYERATARRATTRGQPTRLDVGDTLRFIADYAKIVDGEVDAGRKLPANREVARQLEGRPWAKRHKLSDETIRKLLVQMKNASADVARGKATEFQRQFLDAVLPFIAERLDQN